MECRSFRWADERSSFQLLAISSSFQQQKASIEQMEKLLADS
jgi:hypothetical protein